MENWYPFGLTSEVRRLKILISRQTSKIWFNHNWHICFWCTSKKFNNPNKIRVCLNQITHEKYETVAKIGVRQTETYKNTINRICQPYWIYHNLFDVQIFSIIIYRNSKNCITTHLQQNLKHSFLPNSSRSYRLKRYHYIFWKQYINIQEIQVFDYLSCESRPDPVESCSLYTIAYLKRMHVIRRWYWSIRKDHRNC